MCKSLKKYLGWSPGDEVLERKIMVEHSLVIMELKKAVALCNPSQKPLLLQPIGQGLVIATTG